jgi:hypothetical protein
MGIYYLIIESGFESMSDSFNNRVAHESSRARASSQVTLFVYSPTPANYPILKTFSCPYCHLNDGKLEPRSKK